MFVFCDIILKSIFKNMDFVGAIDRIIMVRYYAKSWLIESGVRKLKC